MKRMRYGFTLIELIIVVSILLILSFGVLVNYNTYNDRQKVHQAAMTLKADLRYVQSLIVSGQKPVSICTTLDAYVVTFNGIAGCASGFECYAITPKCDDALLTDDIRVFTLPKSVIFSTTYSSIEFYPLTRGTNLSAPLIITLTGVGTDNTYSIQVSPSGSVTEI